MLGQNPWAEGSSAMGNGRAEQTDRLGRFAGSGTKTAGVLRTIKCCPVQNALDANKETMIRGVDAFVGSAA